jgi:FkbM family methyltransferase
MCQKDLEIPSPIRPRSIIDAGANIGLSSIYFATAFPDAKIVAIEPDAKNFALCQANTAAYPNVICVRAALWHRAGRVHLANPGAEAWAAQFEESPDQADSVPAMTAWDAIELTGQAETDIFKIDIEGSERDLLLQEDGWLAKVRILLVELHERFVPGCEAAVDAVLAKYPVEKSVQGEKVILRRR